MALLSSYQTHMGYFTLNGVCHDNYVRSLMSYARQMCVCVARHHENTTHGVSVPWHDTERGEKWRRSHYNVSTSGVVSSQASRIASVSRVRRFSSSLVQPVNHKVATPLRNKSHEKQEHFLISYKLDWTESTFKAIVWSTVVLWTIHAYMMLLPWWCGALS